MSIWEWSTTAANNDDAANGINWQENQAPSTVNDSARQMMADIANFLLDQSCSVTSSGTSGALTISTNSGLSSYKDGVLIGFISHTDVSAGATLDVDGNGAKAIVKRDGSAIESGDITNGSAHLAIYDSSGNSGSGAWVALNSVSLTNTTDSIPEGSSNLYHTSARASAAAPVQRADAFFFAATM